MKCTDDARMSHYSNCRTSFFLLFFWWYPAGTCQIPVKYHKKMNINDYFSVASTLHRVMLLEHNVPKISVPQLRLGVGGGALMLGTPHSLGITLHVKHRHYFFLCIFRSLPTLNLSCLTSLTLTWDLPLFYEILWNSERPNTTCLEPFELSLLNFERKIQSYD
jgi:hypothetical protein